MVYIVATLLRKAFERGHELAKVQKLDEIWKQLMLEPQDYSYKAINNDVTRKIIDKTEFAHGGKEYDEKYPEGIPTSVIITLKNGKSFDSKLIMFPSGHARNDAADLQSILDHKFKLLGGLSLN